MKKYVIIGAVVTVLIGAYYGYLHLTAPERGDGGINLSRSGEPASDVALTREVDLFFADSSGRRLALERREITGTGRDGLLQAVIEELVKGPSGENRMRTMPETAQIREVFSRDDLVWVDLGASIVGEHPGGAWTEVLTVYSIVNTVTENFSEVKLVQLIVEGRERETLAGHVDISVPLAGRVQLLAGDWD